MKRIIIATISMLFLAANQTFAYNINHFSNDDKILSALKVLDSIGAEEVFEKLSDNGVKIKFCDLCMVDISCTKDYAISGVDTLGNRHILINSRYENSPKEAIACLIAHESFHTKSVATLSEEVKCTEIEAKYWHRLKHYVSESIPNDLIKRLNRLEHLYLASGEDRNFIAELIINHSFYRNQLALK